MNSISYLAHKVENILRPRKANLDGIVGGTNDVKVNSTDEGDQDVIDDAYPFISTNEKEGDTFDEETIIDDEVKVSLFSLTYIISIVMFIPNLLFVKPIQYIWFIATFPLYLLEKKPIVETNDSFNISIPEDDLKEPYELTSQQVQEDQDQPQQTPPQQQPQELETKPEPTSLFESRKLSNATIFETEEEEPLLIDKHPNDFKSPTSPSSSMFLTPIDIDQTKNTSSKSNSGPKSQNNSQRSVLAFPKTVFPMSLINSPVKKTLILDLDETLIHSISRGNRVPYGSGHMIEVRFQKEVPTLYYVYKRPYCDLFLKQVSKWFNLVIFTASVQEYADPVVDWLETEKKYFKQRFYRDNCTLRKGQGYIKDLSTVDKNLNNVIIVDNSPISYAMHENNAIVVEGWINDPTDSDLLNLIPLLSSLRYTTDVRPVLALKNGEAAFER